MIEVDTVWAPQIVAYAEIVSDRDSLRDCWVSGRCGSTSVTSFDEMVEQIFDDLDSDKLLEDAQRDAAFLEEMVKSISEFLEAIKKIDQAVESGGWSDAPEALLASVEWQAVVDRAGDLLSVAAAVDYEAMR